MADLPRDLDAVHTPVWSSITSGRRSLMGELALRIGARGERSFPHVVKGCPAEAVAFGDYERLGFRTIRDVCVNVIRNESGDRPGATIDS